MQYRTIEFTLGLILLGCSTKPTLTSGDSFSTEHGLAGLKSAMNGANEYCEARNKKAKYIYLKSII